MTTRRMAATVMVLAAAAGLGLAAQQMQSRLIVLRAEVPFDFIVGETTLPAGAYLVESKSDDQALSITSEKPEGPHAYSTVQFLDQPALQGPDEGELVFADFGTQRFLSEVWTKGVSTGLQLPKPKAQEELEKSQPSKRTVVKAKLHKK